MPIDSHLHGQKDEIYWLEETLSQLVFWVIYRQPATHELCTDSRQSPSSSSSSSCRRRRLSFSLFTRIEMLLFYFIIIINSVFPYFGYAFTTKLLW